MIHGMVSAYADPYTRFVEPVQHELETDVLSGSYGGIGAGLEYDQQEFIVLHPFPDGPAMDVGVLDGDRLISIDDWEVQPGTPIDQVIAAIRGPEGTKVTIMIARPPQYSYHTYHINREDIPLPSVTWFPVIDEPRLGLIKVNSIASTTVEEIQNAIDNLKNQGVSHFALDLRGNHGGLLSEGVDIARLFLESGVVIQEHYRDQEINTYEVEEPGLYAHIPLVVFVDGETASAAEIIAGALKLHQRAIIIGAETFGKNSIQLVFSLKDGSSLHVTAAKWWVPDLDSNFSGSGIKPDIPVTTGDNVSDPFIQAAINAYFNEQ
jgi:carboxyl-terminal processing protease